MNTAASQSASTFDHAQIENIYFLDADAALATALQQNTLVTDGQTHLQYCYYDGALFENAPPNLVRVPIKDFTDFFTNSEYPLPTQLVCANQNLSEDEITGMQSSFKDIIEEVRELRAKHSQAAQANINHNDCYFFDRELAYSIAQEQNRVKCPHPTIDGTQICYYDGVPFENAPSNLINLRFESVYDYLINTRNRLPNSISFPAAASLDQQIEIQQLFQRVITEVDNNRSLISESFANEIKQQHPIYEKNQPLRIFMPASRLTEVMQFATNNLAKVFEKMGHIVHVSMEQNDMEHLDFRIRLEEQFNFNPHLIVSINHLNNTYLNPDVVNVVWWQDPIGDLATDNAFQLRDRDIMLSAYQQFDELLIDHGVETVVRQSFCIDSDVFQLYPEIDRHNKIVFIGSSYSEVYVTASDEVKLVINKLIEHLIQGDTITEQLVKSYVDEYQISFHYFWNYALNYVVRDSIVRWLCQQNDIEVEVYGRGWEQDEIVRAFHKGTLSHGLDVAKKYNEATHALVALAHELNSQRLAECTACGCIPVVFDTRAIAEKPHWDDECVFFKTQEQLYRSLFTKPKNDPAIIGKSFSYEQAAENILRHALTKLNG